MFIDTHSHIYADDFNEDISQVIKRASDVGVGKILLPNIDSSSIEPMLKLVADFPDMCMPMMGLHPTSVDKDYKQELDICKQYLLKDSFIAIGEIGIDLYWDKNILEATTNCIRNPISLGCRL